MTDRNKLFVLQKQLATLDQARGTMVIWLVAVLNELHGGQAAVSMEALMSAQQSVFNITQQVEKARGLVRFTVCDGNMKPVLAPRPSGVSAQAMAEQICAAQPEGLAVLDAESLAELFEAYQDNVKRGEQEARAPKLADPAEKPEPPAERCLECFLAYGAHRPDCSQAEQSKAIAS